MKVLILTTILNFFFNIQFDFSLHDLNSSDSQLISIDPRIDESTEAKIIKLVEAFSEDFFEVANFKSENSGLFDLDKYTSFISYFEGDCLVVNDFQKGKNLIPYYDYASLVLNHFSDSGIDCNIFNIQIQSIGLDDSGFYVASISFTKKVMSTIDKRGKVKNNKKGITHLLLMEVNMPEYLLSDIKISKIESSKSDFLDSLIQKVKNISVPKIGSSFKNIFKR